MRTSGRRAITVVGVVIAALRLLRRTRAPSRSATGSLSSAGVADQSCTDGLLPEGPGVVTERVTAPSLGLLHVTLDADSGDWDLGVFDAADGRTVAGAATLGPDEVADGFVLHRTDLIVQACRRSGDDPDAELLGRAPAVRRPRPPARPSLVRVQTPRPTTPTQLQHLGVDLTEHGGPGYVEAVLHGPERRRRC